MEDIPTVRMQVLQSCHQFYSYRRYCRNPYQRCCCHGHPRRHVKIHHPCRVAHVMTVTIPSAKRPYSISPSPPWLQQMSSVTHSCTLSTCKSLPKTHLLAIAPFLRRLLPNTNKTVVRMLYVRACVRVCLCVCLCARVRTSTSVRICLII